MEILIQLSLSLVGGLLMSRLAKLLNLPAVTAYLVCGLLLGPYLLGALDVTGIGFTTPESVSRLDIISQTALGFIAFTIGNEFRVAQLKAMGRQAITVGIFQAVFTTALVDAALVALHFANPELISISSAITLGAIAAATAPAATLMVVRQYKADGPMTKLLLLVVAIDDAVGLVHPHRAGGACCGDRAVPGPGGLRGLGVVPGGEILPLPEQAPVHLHRLCPAHRGAVHGGI